MRSARVWVLLGIAYALAGCGASPRDDVRAKIHQFASATAKREVAILCDQVLAPSLIARLTAAGVSCQQGMKIFVSSVQHPTISISRVTVRGASASAVVLAGATGQRAALEKIQLVQTKSGWRLVSLASP
jgi:selenocysteine lyase/cysteine desulfurase